MGPRSRVGGLALLSLGRRRVHVLHVPNAAPTWLAGLGTRGSRSPLGMKTHSRSIHTRAFEGDLGDLNSVDVNERDSLTGSTPLMYAVGRGQVSAARALIEAGADVDAAADSGYTALMRAAASIKCTDFVRLLLDAGADPDRRDGCGETALDWALANCHTAAVEMLRQVAKGRDAVLEEGTPQSSIVHEGTPPTGFGRSEGVGAPPPPEQRLRDAFDPAAFLCSSTEEEVTDEDVDDEEQEQQQKKNPVRDSMCNDVAAEITDVLSESIEAEWSYMDTCDEVTSELLDWVTAAVIAEWVPGPYGEADDDDDDDDDMQEQEQEQEYEQAANGHTYMDEVDGAKRRVALTREFTKLRDEISCSSLAGETLPPKSQPEPEPEPQPQPQPQPAGGRPKLDQMFLPPDGEQLELEAAVPQHRPLSASFASESSNTLSPFQTRVRGSSVPPAVFSTPRDRSSPVQTVNPHSTTKELAAKLRELGARDPHGLGALLAAQDSA